SAGTSSGSSETRRSTANMLPTSPLHTVFVSAATDSVPLSSTLLSGGASASTQFAAVSIVVVTSAMRRHVQVAIRVIAISLLGLEDRAEGQQRMYPNHAFVLAAGAGRSLGGERSSHCGSTT